MTVIAAGGGTVVSRSVLSGKPAIADECSNPLVAGDKFVEMRKDFFKNGNYPGSALITVTNFARPGIEIEIQAVGVIGDSCSTDTPCSAEAKAKKAQ